MVATVIWALHCDHFLIFAHSSNPQVKRRSVLRAWRLSCSLPSRPPWTDSKQPSWSVSVCSMLCWPGPPPGTSDTCWLLSAVSLPCRISKGTREYGGRVGCSLSLSLSVHFSFFPSLSSLSPSFFHSLPLPHYPSLSPPTPLSSFPSSQHSLPPPVPCTLPSFTTIKTWCFSCWTSSLNCLPQRPPWWTVSTTSSK